MFNRIGLLLSVIAIIVLPMFVSVPSAEAAWVGAHWFSLDRWDGGFRIDVQANCPYKAKIEVYNHSNGQLLTYWDDGYNGWWRVYPDTHPRTSYDISFYCFDGPNDGVHGFTYRVWYSGSYIYAARIA